MDKDDLREGQQVRVFEQDGPEGGWPGEVAHIGRSLVTISYRWSRGKFRIGTQHSAGPFGSSIWFRMLEQVALDERRDAAVRTLRAHRVYLDHVCPLTLEQIEALAAVVAPREDDSGHQPV